MKLKDIKELQMEAERNPIGSIEYHKGMIKFHGEMADYWDNKVGTTQDDTRCTRNWNKHCRLLDEHFNKLKKMERSDAYQDAIAIWYGNIPGTDKPLELIKVQLPTADIPHMSILSQIATMQEDGTQVFIIATAQIEFNNVHSLIEVGTSHGQIYHFYCTYDENVSLYPIDVGDTPIKWFYNKMVELEALGLGIEGETR